MKFSTLQEARAAFLADRKLAEQKGVILQPSVQSYVPEGWGYDFEMAMDALPTLTLDPNSAVPSFLTTMIDPDIYKILFAPTEAANIAGEVKKGTWLDETVMFPVVEHTGEVSSYGDFNENGRSGANTNWPQRQSYLFQTMKEYGERELERAGLAKINWVGEIDQAAADIMNRYTNLTYFFGVTGLQNYGLLNDPNLGASLTPATKIAGGTAWITSGGVINATANEVYADIQSMFYKLVTQTSGLIKAKDALTLAMSPGAEVALTITNAFGVNVNDLLKKNFPNLEVKTAVQYGVLSAANPQGVAGGNLLQLFAGKVSGQKSLFCAFNEKMRAHPIIRAASSFKQKTTGGTWGTVIRMPVGVVSMIGV